jgi:uncharacterized protein
VRRVVVDTNVWVSALLNRAGAPARIRTALEERRFRLVASEPLLAEVAEVLACPRLARKYSVTSADREELISLLRARAIIVPVEGAVQVCRDPDDDVVIETALRGRAELLVTRDDDLKRAAEVIAILSKVGIGVLSVQRFLAELDSG